MSILFEIDRRFARRSILAPPTGLEPVTHGLTVRCSADCTQIHPKIILKQFSTIFCHTKNTNHKTETIFSCFKIYIKYLHINIHPPVATIPSLFHKERKE